ncbi:hypothetical protein [Pseudonocardia sp. GCM10023141]|uniref:hypothetical protein n=1 Tax=Pseudonocardia sp. GCM10023141 TaxID=3252653 RepID=UPI0036063C32
MPDRYADAVRARRAELRAERALLDGSQRVELRGELALSRIGAAEAAAAALAAVGRAARSRIDDSDRAGGEQLPGQVGAALGAVVAAVHAGWAADLAPALRRIATRRGIAVEPGWPVLPPPRSAVSTGRPEPIRRGRSLLAGAAEGVAVWRLALLPLAVLPLLGLPALGGPRFAPLAVGLGLLAIVLAVRSGRTGLRRAALRRCIEEMIGAARITIDTDLGRRLLELDRVVGAELDAAVLHRRGVVDAELQALAPDRSLEVAGG